MWAPKSVSRRGLVRGPQSTRTLIAPTKSASGRWTGSGLNAMTTLDGRGRGVNKPFRRRLHKSSLTATMEDRPTPIVGTPTVAEQTTGVTLYFASNWPRAVLHYSLEGKEWTDADFTRIEDTDWHVLTLDALDVDTALSNGSPLLEFVITDRQDSWEKPHSGAPGGNYKIAETGTYSISRGEIERVNLKPTMVVSDLDGTMIGDDAATASFQQFWKRHRAATQSTLVYNTGRSLESFLKLLEDKRHCLEVPDVLVSAVGTKIYQHRSGTWPEDPDWIALLDEGWNLSVVQSATRNALKTVGDENMHFRPPEEQNEHKVTCGVKKAALEQVTAQLEQQLEAGNVEANIISSGIGEWRFLDIVSKKAGKLEALEYVRKQHGFTESSTIACGDSGNDILMLSGTNRAIVVGNAQPDLIEWLKEQQIGDGSRLYLSQQHEAYGILEGLKKFGFY